jgi:hypothetical protein
MIGLKVCSIYHEISFLGEEEHPKGIPGKETADEAISNF